MPLTTAIVLCLFNCFCVVAPAAAATYQVTTVADGAPMNDSECTLREAITQVNQRQLSSGLGCGNYDGASSDVIIILPPVFGSIILESNLPQIQHSVDILGSGPNNLAIDGQNLYQAFSLGTGTGDSFSIANISIVKTLGSNFLFAGAITLAGGNSLLVNEVRFSQNRGARVGGMYIKALVSQMTKVSINNSTFINNSVVTVTDGFSGAVFAGAQNLDLTIKKSIFDSNKGRRGGAISVGSLANGADAGEANVVIENSSFTRNSITKPVGSTDFFAGGAIYLSSGLGGVATKTSAQISNSTVAFNSVLDLNSPAFTTGGGIGALGEDTFLTLQNTIVAGNAVNLVADDIDRSFSATVISSGHNLIGSNKNVVAEFPVGLPNSSQDFAGDVSSPINSASVFAPIVVSPGVSKFPYLPLEPSSFANDAGGACGVAMDLLDRSRSECSCDIGAVESLLPKTCSNMFVVPLQNGKSVIFDL